MSEIRRAAADLNQDVRTLQDDELATVNGGIMIIGGRGALVALGGPDTRPAGHQKDWIEIHSYSLG